jgi:hypothetical protein
VYVLNHFGLHHARITRYYYFSYLAIPTYLAVIGLVGELSRQVAQPRRTIVLVTASAAYVATYLLYSPEAAAGTVLLGLWTVTAIVAPLAMTAVAWPTVRLTVLLASVIAAPIPFYYSAEDYIDLHSRSRAAVEWDMYRASFQIEKVIGAALDTAKGRIRFWYNPALPGHDSLNALQSTYLWGYSRIPRMPAVDGMFHEQRSDARYLVLIGLSDDEVDRGLAALTSAGLPYRLVRRERSGGTVWSCVFAILDMPPKAAA